MKTLIKVVIVSICLLSVKQNAACQGFVNLNFEAAKIIPFQGGAYLNGVAASNALPGWTVYLGSNQQSEVAYNAPSLGSTFISIWATNGQQISGNFSVLLQGGITASAASITQTGLVPVSAESIIFEAQVSSAGLSNSLQVSLGVQNLSYSVLSLGPNYTLYGADVSVFAGQIEPLTFSALEGGGNSWNIDNIQFSSSPIPEPSTLALTVLGTFLLGFRRWRKGVRPHGAWWGGRRQLRVEG